MNITWQIRNGLLTLGRAWVLACLCVLSLSAEEPYVHWAASSQALSGSEALLVTGDGRFYGTSYNGVEGYLMTFSSQGELVSSNYLAGVSLTRVATDALGNKYWTGRINAKGTFDFPAVQGFFVAKFGPTNNLLWVRSNELPDDGNLYHRCDRISVDGAGNIAVGGTISGRFKLGSFETAGEESPFFCKFDPEGNLLWARKIASQYFTTNVGGSCWDIALDSSGNVIVCGFLSEGSSDFGGTTVYPGTVHGYGGDWFIAKYNLNGELLWVTLDYAMSLAVDRQGDIYVTFVWPKDNLSGIAKLNGSGGLLWQKNLPVFMWLGGMIALDELGQPVFTGEYSGTVNLDAITLQHRGKSDFFVAKADVDGNVLWAISGGGQGGADSPSGIACDNAGNVFLSAYSSSGGTFDGINIRPGRIMARLSERPPVKMAGVAGSTLLSWPAKATNYVMEAATSLAPGSAWSPVLTPPTTVGRNSTLPVDTTAPAHYFRLHKP